MKVQKPTTTAVIICAWFNLRATRTKSKEQPSSNRRASQHSRASRASANTETRWFCRPTFFDLILEGLDKSLLAGEIDTKHLNMICRGDGWTYFIFVLREEGG